MANNTETSTWEAGVYQFESSDPIQGGPGGVDNLPHVQLGNRTRWLYDNKVGISGSWALAGTYTFSGPVRLANNNPLLAGDASGAYRSVMVLFGTNDLHIGDVGNALTGSVHLRSSAASSVKITVGNAVKMETDSDGPRLTSALSGADNSLRLVSSSWVRAYAAPLDSPALTGVPTAPLAAADTSSAQLATTAFVLNQRATTTPPMNGVAAVGTSLRWSRADHVHPTDTTRAPVNNAVLTGAPTAPTPGAGDDSQRIATTAWARDLIDSVFASQSLAQTGYQVLPGGLILQWGRSTTTANPVSVSFPIAFPSACFCVFTQSRRNAPLFQAVAVWGETQNGFDSYHDNAGISFAWFAIGK